MKRFLQFVEDKMNIKFGKNFGVLYLSMFLQVLFCGYSCPRVTKEIVSCLPVQYLSVESMSCCVSTLLIGMLWKGKTRETVVKNFMVLAVLETVASVALGIWLLFINYNVWVMAIASIVYVNCISIFISKCVMTFKSKLFLEKTREDFDNGCMSLNCIASLLGLTCSLFFVPSLPTAVAFWSLACVFDDIGWIIVYNKNKCILTSEFNERQTND